MQVHGVRTSRSAVSLVFDSRRPGGPMPPVRDTALRLVIVTCFPKKRRCDRTMDHGAARLPGGSQAGVSGCHLAARACVAPLSATARPLNLRSPLLAAGQDPECRHGTAHRTSREDRSEGPIDRPSSCRCGLRKPPPAPGWEIQWTRNRRRRQWPLRGSLRIGLACATAVLPSRWLIEIYFGFI